MGKVYYHPNFDEYVEMIVSHPNYEGLFYERNEDGRVGWVVTGKSREGQIRQQWWDKKCGELNVPLQKGCYARVARLLHPTGKHVCQCCGEERSIFYEYPTKPTVEVLNRILGTEIDKDDDRQRTECTIGEIVEGWCNTEEQVARLAEAFKLPATTDKRRLMELIYEEMVKKESRRFSPGVMCNPPDRFNGMHSYAICCRTKNDKGRGANNMQTYTQDRRAYEDWADGDYNLANRLMGEFRKQLPMPCPVCGNVAKMSADHIGPISLGFCHSHLFTPMCRSCNSAKNNRFTKSDVDELVSLEQEGTQVISWHSKYIWDMVKGEVHDDVDAKKASSVMAKCHQNVLNILAIIYKKTGGDFLMRYLHPEYSMKDYRFEDFDLMHLDRMKVVERPLDSKNKMKNRERYVRIAFESLEEFLSKDNRKNGFVIDANSPMLTPVLDAVGDGDYDLADEKLKALIQKVSASIYEKEKAE